MICRVSLMLIALASTCTPASAEDAAVEESDPEFIEFLGEWQTDEGEWVDPDDLGSDAYRQAATELEQARVGERADE
jgi:hypothetical protein